MNCNASLFSQGARNSMCVTGTELRSVVAQFPSLSHMSVYLTRERDGGRGLPGMWFDYFGSGILFQQLSSHPRAFSITQILSERISINNNLSSTCSLYLSLTCYGFIYARILIFL